MSEFDAKKFHQKILEFARPHYIRGGCEDPVYVAMMEIRDALKASMRPNNGVPVEDEKEVGK